MLSAVALFAAVFALYASTLFPSVPGGDSGELLAEACLGGVAHPPGYPTFTMISGAAMALPVPLAPAAKSNLVFAAIAAVAPVAIAVSATILVRGKGDGLSLSIGGVFGGALFAISPLTWTYSSGSEVFSLNNCLAALMTLGLVKYDALSRAPGATKPPTPTLSFLCFVSALACTNQHTIVFYVIPFAAWVLVVGQSRHGWTLLSLSICALWIVAGFLPYAYLPLASARATPGSWGDLTTVQGFLTHFLRSEYGTLKLSPGTFSTSNYIARLIVFQGHTLKDLLPFVPLLSAVLLGIGVLATSVTSAPGIRARSVGVLLVSSWLGYILVFHYLANLPVDSAMPRGVLARFWMQADVVSAMVFAVGIETIIQYLEKFIQYQAKPPSVKEPVSARRPAVASKPAAPELPTPAVSPATGWASPITKLTVVFVVFVAGQIAIRLPIVDHSGLYRSWYPPSDSHRNLTKSAAVNVVLPRNASVFLRSPAGLSIHSYGATVLSQLPEHSLLLSHTDLTWNSVRYLQACEGQRPDITHLNLHIMPYPWFTRQHFRFPGVVFPPVLPDASTDITHRAYKRDLVAFLIANLESGSFPGGVFLDNHAIGVVDLGESNTYAGSKVMMVAHGVLWRAVLKSSEAAWKSLKRVGWPQSASTALNQAAEQITFADTGYYPEGTWEHGVMQMYFGGLYQYALSLLTVQIETSANGKENQLSVTAASTVFSPPFSVSLHRLGWHPAPGQTTPYFIEAARLLHLLSLAFEDKELNVPVPEIDIRKNTALAMMKVAYIVDSLPRLHVSTFMDEAKLAISAYIRGAPKNDPDVKAFSQFLEALVKITSQQQQPRK